jgi:hypothetical protein
VNPDIAVRSLVFAVGLAIVAFTVASAVRTTVLPRGYPSRIGRVVFLSVRFVFTLRAGRSAPYERRDRIMALYGPISLLLLLIAWITLILTGFALMVWALGGVSPGEAFRISGSSVTTLGTRQAPDLLRSSMSYLEATFGLILLALLITYLPSIYGAFSRREQLVTALEVRAGSPPSGSEMLWRFGVLGRVEKLTETWERWEDWFVEVEESHSSFPALVTFRSPQPDHSWVTAAGAVLDGAALLLSSVDVPRDVQAEIMIRAGYLALRRIASFFQIPFDPDPDPGDPISVRREEYEAVCGRIAEAGLSLKPDRDQAWRDFAGWRVNYDAVLLGLASLTMAPEAPWSSDRMGDRAYRPPVFRQANAARTRPRSR